jgi:hypothetical protein
MSRSNLPEQTEICSQTHPSIQSETINRIEHLKKLAADHVDRLLLSGVVSLVDEVTLEHDSRLRGDRVVVLKIVLHDDLRLLPVDSLVAWDSRSAGEAAVEFVGKDAVVAFVLRLAPGGPLGDVELTELVAGGEDGGNAEDGGKVGVEARAFDGLAAEGGAEGSWRGVDLWRGDLWRGDHGRGDHGRGGHGRDDRGRCDCG